MTVWLPHSDTASVSGSEEESFLKAKYLISWNIGLQRRPSERVQEAENEACNQEDLSTRESQKSRPSSLTGNNLAESVSNGTSG
jgi:hypothetical protein